VLKQFEKIFLIICRNWKLQKIIIFVLNKKNFLLKLFIELINSSNRYIQSRRLIIKSLENFFIFRCEEFFYILCKRSHIKNKKFIRFALRMKLYSSLIHARGKNS